MVWNGTHLARICMTQTAPPTGTIIRGSRNNNHKQGATVEGLNIGGIMLLYLSLIVFGIGTLGAVGLWIGRLPRAALLTFASGQLFSAIIAAFATLTFLGREFHHEDENMGMILLIATILLLAGSGQFIAAIRCPRYYGAALACGAASILFLAGSSRAGVDWIWIGNSGMRFQSRPGIALLLAVACLVIAVLPLRRRTSPLLWTALGGLGVIAGLAVGDLLVATHCQQLGPPEHANVSQVRVEIYVLGFRVSEETGMAPIPDEGPGAIRFLSIGQALIVYATQIGFAASGLFAALGIGAKLVEESQSAQTVPSPPAISDELPPIHGYSSEQIKRM